MLHHVYFAECQDFIKIGVTKNDLQSHLSVMQIYNPFKITILAYISCDCDRKSTPTLGTNPTCTKESELHDLFLESQVKHLHPETEWFHATDKLREYIKKHGNALYIYKIR